MEESMERKENFSFNNLSYKYSGENNEDSSARSMNLTNWEFNWLDDSEQRRTNEMENESW